MQVIKATRYSFTFNPNGGTFETVPTELTTLAYVSDPGEIAKEGFEFGGWYTDADFTNAFNFDADYLRTNDVTLYQHRMVMQLDMIGWRVARK